MADTNKATGTFAVKVCDVGTPHSGEALEWVDWPAAPSHGAMHGRVVVKGNSRL